MAISLRVEEITGELEGKPVGDFDLTYRASSIRRAVLLEPLMGQLYPLVCANSCSASQRQLPFALISNQDVQPYHPAVPLTRRGGARTCPAMSQSTSTKSDDNKLSLVSGLG